MCFPLSSISNYILEPNSLKLMNVSPSFMIHCCCCLATGYITYTLYLLFYEKHCYSLKQFCHIDKVLSILCRWIALPFPLSLSDWPSPTGLQQFYNQDNNQCLPLILWILLIRERSLNFTLNYAKRRYSFNCFRNLWTIRINVLLDEQSLFHCTKGCEATLNLEH